MDKVIKEGTLRLLITESTCDVILSCSDHRLMAHKLILSIASPVFRELLRKSDSTSVLILPDINSSTMSAILDYIYSGTTVVTSNALDEFLSVARFLQIVVDRQNIENIFQSLEYVKKHDKEDLVDCSSKKAVESITENRYKDDLKDQTDKMEFSDFRENKSDHNSEPDTKYSTNNVQISEPIYSQTKPQKRLPNLLPIGVGRFRKNAQKNVCNSVVPSPWCQRDGRSFLEDPRILSLKSPESETQKAYLEDTNNNFQPTKNTETSKHNSKNLDTIIRHLYLNNSEVRKGNSNRSNNISLDQSQSENSSSAPPLRTTNEEKNSPEKLQLPKFTNFPFSRHLTGLLPFGRICSENTTSRKEESNAFCEVNLSKDNSSSNEGLANPLCYDRRSRTTKIFTPKNYREDKSSIEDVRISNLPKNTLSSAQSSPIRPFSSEPLSPPPYLTTVLPPGKIPNISPDNSEIEHSLNDTIANSNDASNSIHDNSNDNSVSSDSSNDEKKESVKKKAFKCEDCGKSFSQLRNYKYHRSVHEGTKEFSAKCPECGKTFNDRGYLSSHMKIHRDRKEYACPNCPKRFNQRVAYNMHLRIHTGVKPHECPTCGKSFSRKMLLKQHQRVHTGERPYSCPECGKTFADRSNMSLHARLHTGVKPYACTVCPKSFTKKHHLKTHMNFHTGLKPYTCENCGLAFSQSSNMRTHYKKCILKDKLGHATKTESLSSADNNSS